MADQSSSPLGLPPTLWVVLAVGLAGAFAVNHRGFQDTRPPDQNVPAYRHTPSSDQDVEAREWEDPFTAVAVARSADSRSQAGPAAPSDQPPPPPPATALHDLNRLRAVVRAHPHDPLLVLGAIVPGAPYADDVETRRRTRYAVLAGLSSSGYAPDDDEHVGYTRLALPPDTAGREIAAYEWFHSELPPGTGAQRPTVLVLWLDQENFRDAPLHRFSRIVDFIAPVEAGFESVANVILGPADSDGLRAMSSELEQGGCDSLAKSGRSIPIYSPRATAVDWWIVSDAVKKRYADTESDPRADHFNDRCEHVHLYRTVATDLAVLKSLYGELQYRGIRSVGEIALITERDTLYARLISQYFNGCDGTAASGPEFTVTGESDSSKPLCFTYLRGLDGLAPPAPASTESSTAPNDKTGAGPGAGAQTPAAPDTATGRAQLDYLRRLTLELASLRDDPSCGWISKALYLGDQTRSASRCARRIKAIGVVGSDVYDKLLVLQALRSAFPRYIFFTTDLDARLTDEQNLPWSRELVVGSSLGLSLRPEVQGSIPPFRDTYQSATYYSTRRAVQELPGKHDDPEPLIDLTYTHRPHVFEIGRSQAFDLTVDHDARLPCDKNLDCRSIAESRSAPLWSTSSAGSSVMVAAVAVLIGLFIAAAAMGDRWVLRLAAPLYSSVYTGEDRRRLVTAAVTFAAIALSSIWGWASLVHTLNNDGKRVPAPIFSGTSHWAASMFEALSILSVITLVIRGQRKLHDNAEEMLKEFQFPTDAQTLIEAYRNWLRSKATARRRRWKERLWLPLRRLSGNQQDPLPVNGLSALENLVAQYLYRGRWPARLRRVGFITLIASLVLLVLEYILMIFEFNMGVSFVRGFALIDTHYVERGIEDGISLLNLLTVQFLIFWVADAMLLTRSFALALKEDKPHWPDAVIGDQMKELGLPQTWAEAWLDLRLIAWRTGRVASLIWYPSLVIAAMAVAALTVEFGEFGFASNPIALLISSGFVACAGVLLRRIAEAWRSDVLFRLEDAKLHALQPPDPRGVKVEQLDRLSERVEALTDGAFAPYSQQPIVRAVFVPALTYGATAGLQYLHISE
jgi:hypothetical protein